jgi:hypothetical protein
LITCLFLEELATLPSLVPLPTLVSSQSSNNTTKSSVSSTGDTSMIGKLSEAMGKLIQKQSDITSKLNPLKYLNKLLLFPSVAVTTEADDAVPISAKHLERLERVSFFYSPRISFS